MNAVSQYGRYLVLPDPICDSVPAYVRAMRPVTCWIFIGSKSRPVEKLQRRERGQRIDEEID